MPDFPRPINALTPILTRRRISPEEAITLGMVVHTGEEIGDMLGKAFSVWLKGTFLPYPDVDGEPLLTEHKKLFCRWRLERKDGKPMGLDEHRYMQPPGSGV